MSKETSRLQREALAREIQLREALHGLQESFTAAHERVNKLQAATQANPDFSDMIAGSGSEDRGKLLPDWETAQRNFVDLSYALQTVKLLHLHLYRDPLLKGSLEPLALLGNALHDLAFGGRPPLFFDVRFRQGGTKPVFDTGALTQGKLAGAADLLIKAGMTRAETKAWLGERIAYLEILDEDGEFVVADRILRCRDNYNLTPPRGAVGAWTTFRDLQQLFAPFLAGTNRAVKVAWAQDEAEAVLRFVSTTARRTFPRANRKPG